MTAVRPVQAGELAALFEAGDLRQVRYGGAEVVRRISAAVRDPTWASVPGRQHSLRFDVGGAGFRIAYATEHDSGPLGLSCRHVLHGEADGTLRYRWEATARRPFPYARIGICVLHPPQWAGAGFTADLGGREWSGRLPRLVEPQWLRDGVLRALGPPFHRLTVTAPGSLRVTHEFQGDRFETEDQRNWGDASFKTYSTPLADAPLHQARLGQRFSQSVTVTVVGTPPLAPGGVALSMDGDHLGPMPALGVSLPRPVPPLDPQSVSVLAALRLEHLRVDLWPGHVADWELAVPWAAALGADLEVALHDGAVLPAGSGPTPGTPAVRRLLVLREGVSTGTAEIAAVRRELGGGAAAGPDLLGGTDLYFAELNRDRPAVAGLDGVVYPLTPQVHADDDRSVLENIQAQADTVRTARSLSGGRPVSVSPITLAPRFNPFAPGPRPPPPNDGRQHGLFGAAWTAGSLAELAAAGAASATYYETVGPRGVADGADLYPLGQVLAALAEWGGAQVLAGASSQPQLVSALALRRGARRCLLAANLTGADQEVTVAGVRRREARRLDETTGLRWKTCPGGAAAPLLVPPLGLLWLREDGRAG